MDLRNPHKANLQTLCDIFNMTKHRLLLLLIMTSAFVFSQKQFVGSYREVDYIDSILLNDNCEKTKLTIKSDYSFTFKSTANKKECGEIKTIKFQGSWNFKGDTIFFFNDNFKIAKEPTFESIPDNSLTGIRIKVFDQRGKQILLNSIDVTRLSVTRDTANTISADTSNVKEFTLTDKRIIQLTVFPENFGKFKLDLSQISFGTEVRVTCFSDHLQTFFNGRPYFSKNGNLFEIPTCGGLTPFEFSRFKRE